MANLGRRPAVLLSLVMTSGKDTWSRPIKEAEFGDEKLEIGEAVKLLHRHMLAQNSAVKLPEGDVLDLQFWPDDCPVFIHSSSDANPVPVAERLFVEDCSGRRYRVKGDEDGLRKLFVAWSP